MPKGKSLILSKPQFPPSVEKENDSHLWVKRDSACQVLSARSIPQQELGHGFAICSDRPGKLETHHAKGMVSLRLDLLFMQS